MSLTLVDTNILIVLGDSRCDQDHAGGDQTGFVSTCLL